MEKSIIATNIDGLLLEHEVFFEPHRIWFDRAILLTKNESLTKWKGQKDYFMGVNEAMKQIMPNATEEERTVQARKWYQEDVIYYIQTHPEVIKKEIKEKLKKLKGKYKLALVTTNTEEYILKILEISGFDNLFDIIFATKLNEVPDKKNLFKKFIKKYGKPLAYIAAKNGELWEECIELGILTVYIELDPKKVVKEAFKTADVIIQNKKQLEKLNFD